MASRSTSGQSQRLKLQARIREYADKQHWSPYGRYANAAVAKATAALDATHDYNRALSIGKLELDAQDAVYLAIADRQVEAFSPDDQSFNSSLLLNVLFQPSITIPDIFFFISRPVLDHLRSRPAHGESLLSAALRAGIVIPSFRHFDADDFRGAYQRVHGIQGLLTPDECKTACELLDKCTLGSDFKLTYWPVHSVGERYERRLRTFFERDTVPGLDAIPARSRARLTRIWNDTAPFRATLDAAVARTAANDGAGLRRGALMTEVGQQLGLPAECEVNDVRELFAAAASESSRRREAVRVFCQWMTEAYAYNQAVEFRAQPDFPNYGPDSAVSLAALAARPRPSTNDSEPQRAVLRATARLPSMATLLGVDPETLIRIRREEGEEYRQAAIALLRRHSPQRENRWRESLAGYSRALRKRFAKEPMGPASTLEVLLQRTPRGVPPALEGLADLASFVASSVEPVLVLPGAILMIDRAGHTIHNLVTYADRQREIELWPRRRSEVVVRRN